MDRQTQNNPVGSWVKNLDLVPSLAQITLRLAQTLTDRTETRALQNTANIFDDVIFVTSHPVCITHAVFPVVDTASNVTVRCLHDAFTRYDHKSRLSVECERDISRLQLLLSSATAAAKAALAGTNARKCDMYVMVTSTDPRSETLWHGTFIHGIHNRKFITCNTDKQSLSRCSIRGRGIWTFQVFKECFFRNPTKFFSKPFSSAARYPKGLCTSGRKLPKTATICCRSYSPKWQRGCRKSVPFPATICCRFRQLC